jgi:flagellar hook-associated protein 2
MEVPTMAISSIGVGSKLDLSSLLDNLQQAENTKLAALNSKAAVHNTKFSAYAQLQGALASFQIAASTLGTASLYNSTTTTSSNTGVLTVAADKTAVAGSYAINVSQLAQAQTLVSNGITDSTGQQLGSARIKIEFGTTVGNVFTPGAATPASININGTNNTLAGIRDAINQSNSGVTASIVNDGGATPYHLVLTSNTTGEKSSMRVSVEDNGGGDPSTIAGLLTYDPAGTKAMTENIKATDAKLTINGLDVISPTNVVQGAAQGITLNLLSTGASTVTANTDTGAMASAVKSFVDGYNALQSTAKKLSAFDKDIAHANQGAGEANQIAQAPLLGDATLRTIQNQLRSVFNTPQDANGNTSLVNLTQIGISFKADGTMGLDTGKLNKALSDNRTGVAQLFSGADGKSGYGNQLSDMVKSFSAPKGALTMANDGINANMKDLKATYDRTSAAIDATMLRYRAQFQQLDLVVNRLNSTAAYLTQQFAAMNNTNNK